MLAFILVEFIAFPSRKDSILSQVDQKSVDLAVSGSIGYFYNGKCVQTYPNQTLNNDEKLDWCSNVAKSKDDKPWITYSLQNKAMRLTGYSVRSGCCYYTCCCLDESGLVDYCCCELYSFSLQGSNDNKTWKVIHKVEKDDRFYICMFKTYEFPMTESFKYVRFVQESERPGCAFCMAINQIEFYGETVDSNSREIIDSDDDESVSIIGKVGRNEAI